MLKPKVILVDVFWSDSLKEGCHSAGTVNIPGAHQGYLHLELTFSLLWIVRFHFCEAIRIE